MHGTILQTDRTYLEDPPKSRGYSAGTGYMVAHLSKAVGKDGTVIAIDAEAAMVEYLAKRSGDLGPARVVPRKVGPDDPELRTGSVDGVLTLDTWHHVKGREAYAKK